MNHLHNIYLSILYIIVSSFCSSLHAQTVETYYAKNSGLWAPSNPQNWTVDASGLVFSNPSNIVPGVIGSSKIDDPSGTRVNVSIQQGRKMTLNMSAEEGEWTTDYININELNLEGELVINLPSGSTQRITIHRLIGNGVLRVNATEMLRLLIDENNMMRDFVGTVVLDDPASGTHAFGNPLSGSSMPMPASTLANGTIILGTDYFIDGNLVVESGSTLKISPNITVTVTGNVINRGTIASSSAGGNSTLRIYGNLDNSAGTLRLFDANCLTNASATPTLCNTVTEFVGGSSADFILNASSSSNNLVYRILCNKQNGRSVNVYSADKAKTSLLALAAVPSLNSGSDYKNMPFVVESGVLDLGNGVSTTGAIGWWNAVHPSAVSSVPSLSSLEDTKGAIYIPEGAALSISGADITVGAHNPVFIAGELHVNSGSFTSGAPGIFYVYPYGNVDSKSPSRLTISGGELHISRNVCLKSGSNPRPAVHHQLGGKMCFDVESDKWDDASGFSNKTIYLGTGSEFVMHGGELHIIKNAVGDSETYSVGGEKVQFIMADANGNELPSLFDGGNIYLGDGSTSVEYDFLVTNAYDITVKAKATAHALTLSGKVDKIRIGGNLTVNGTLKSKNDVYVGGDLNVSKTGVYDTDGSEPSLTFNGKTNATYSCASTKNVNWGSLVLAKEQNSSVTIASGSSISLTGDMLANSGKLIGNVSLVSKTTQKISNFCSDDMGFSGVNLTLANPDAKSTAVKTTAALSTNVVLNKVLFNPYQKFYLDYYNLKCLEYPEKINNASWSKDCSFEVPSVNTAAANGLSLPVLASRNSGKVFPMSVGSTHFTTVSIKYELVDIGNPDVAYVTVTPVAEKHPSFTSKDSALGCYWIISCSEDRVITNHLDLYKCQSMAEVKIKNNSKQVILTSEGWRKGKTPGVEKIYVGYDLTFGNTGDGDLDRLSGDFTVADITDLTDNYVYFSVEDGDWDDAIWVRSKMNPGKGVSSIEIDNTRRKGSQIDVSDNVFVRNNVTLVNSTSSANAGVVTINSGASLAVLESCVSNISFAAIDGEGTLEYQADGTGDLKFLSTKRLPFCNNAPATFVINNTNGSARTLNLASSLHSFPNLTIKGSGSVTLSGTSTDLTTLGNLEVAGSATFNSSTGYSVLVNKDLNVSSSTATFVVGSSSANKELQVRGNISNSGTISGGGVPVYLYGGVANNNSLSISGDVHFYGTTGAESSVKVTGSASSTKLGDAIFIDKEASDCMVEFQTPVYTVETSGVKYTDVSIIKGILNLNQNVSPTTLRQYPSSAGSDFKIPVEGSLYLYKGTANIAIKPSARVNSLYLAGKMQLSGGSTLNVHGISSTSNRGLSYSTNASLEISNGATLNTMFVTPTSEGSSLNLTTRNAAYINCVQGGLTDMLGFFGIFDVRNGDVDLSAGTKINICNIATESVSTPSLYFAPSSSSVSPGSTITISSDTNKDGKLHFAVDALSPLGSMVVNSKYVKLLNDGLSLLGALTINSGNIFDASSLDLSLAGDLTVNGSYDVSGSQTTSFVGTSPQTLTSFSPLSLVNMLSEASSLSIKGANVDVQKSLAILSGNVDVDNVTLRSYLDTKVNKGAVITGNGLVIGNGASSTAASSLFCEGTVSRLEIDNPSGVLSILPQAEPISVSSTLVMTRGVFNIGGNLIDLLGTANIVNSDPENLPYSISKMIATNGSFTDNGVKVHWPKVGDSRSLTIPLGKASVVYSPVILTDMVASVAGELVFSSADEVHPILLSSAEYNSYKTLPYYWVLVSNLLKTSSGTLAFEYHKSDDYSGMKSISLSMTSSDWEVGADVTSISNGVRLSYDVANRVNYTGDYTASSIPTLPGLDVYVAMPSSAQLTDGKADWFNTIWMKSKFRRLADGTITYWKSGDAGVPAGLDFDSRYNIVNYGVAIIPSGTYVHVPSGNAPIYMKMTGIDGTLEFADGCINNTLYDVKGYGGTLKVNSAEGVPAAKYGDFCASYGGTLEFSGTTDYNVLVGFSKAKNLKFTGSGKRILRSDIDVTVLGNVTVDGPELVFQNGRSLDIFGSSALALNGGTVTGTGNFSLLGSSAQVVSNAGNVSVPGLVIDNAAGVDASNSLAVDNISLLHGVLRLGDNSLTVNSRGTISGGSSSSYIDGMLKVTPVRGARVAYPLGNGSEYANTELTVMTDGQWALRYYHTAPPAPKKSNFDGVTKFGEYWYLKAPSSGAKAYLSLRWNGNSGNTFKKSSNLLYRVLNPDKDWQKLDFNNYSGTESLGKLTTVEHSVDYTNGDIYVLTVSNSSTEFLWVGRTDNAWGVSDNWLWREVPSISSDVTIQSSEHAPVISSGNAYMNSLRIKDGASLTLNGGMTTIKGTLTVDANASVTLQDAGTTLKTKDIVNNGAFTVKYRYDANPNLRYTGSLTGANKFDVKRTLVARQRYYTGSATAERVVKNGDDSNLSQYDYFRYIPAYGKESSRQNEATNASSVVLHGSAELPAEGSLLSSIMTSASIINFGYGITGDASGERTLTQIGTLSPAMDNEFDIEPSRVGWVWLSQPYPYTISVRDIVLGENTYPTIFARGSEQFITYNTATDISVNGSLSYLAPFQSFAVANVLEESTDPVAPVRLFSPVVASETVNLKSASCSDDNALRLVATNANGKSDEVALVFSDKALYSSSSLSSPKWSVDKAHPSISISNSAIAVVPPLGEISTEVVYPLTLSGVTDGLTIMADVESIDKCYDVFLVDKNSGTTTNLRNTTFVSVEDPETIAEGSIYIAFQMAPEGNVVPADSFTDNGIHIYSSSSDIVVDVDEVANDATLMLYNLYGQLLLAQDIRNARTVVRMTHDGIFVAKVVNGADTQAKKLLLKK